MNPFPAKELVIYPLSENAVTIEFGIGIDENLLAQVSALDQSLRAQPFTGMYDTVPAYCTLTVFFDPLLVINDDKLKGKTCFEKVSAYLEGLGRKENAGSIAERTIINIPVCYGGELGPDLEYLARYHKLSTDDVIRLHSEPVYTVYMMGFVPGFAYMGGLNSLLETPRRDTPRKAVPAGSVGIAGKQTGIYPLETPGGWQIIGQTPLKLFDANDTHPALLSTGDRVKFEPISQHDFNGLKSKNPVNSK